MAIAAEPQVASLPLPGGQEGATVRLHPLLTGIATGSPAFFHRGEGRTASLRALGFGVPKSELVRVPVPAFLVEHPAAGPLMIDTGLHPSAAVDPKQNLGRIGTRLFRGLEMDASQAAPAQLRERGVDPAEIGVVVMTHLHLDHASAMSEFPGAAFVVSGREWEAATAPRGSLRGYVRAQFDHAFDLRTVDFDGPEAGSFATFGRSLDLFGDGSVRLVYTPGHTHGHESVILRLGDREALIAGDAIYTMRTLRYSHLPWRVEDGHLFRRSLREIQLYAEQTPEALIVPGHDWPAWQELEAVYG